MKYCFNHQQLTLFPGCLSLQQVDTQNLLSETSQYASAGDDRQSAQTVGYLGICMFAFVFGGLFLLDLTALARDMRIFARNVRGGLERLWDFINGED